MSFRGRLICPFVIELARLDPEATAAVDPPGPVGVGYDSLFDEPTLEGPVDAGQPVRRELAPILIPAQIEEDSWEALAMVEAGNLPDTAIEATCFYPDLEDMGLVDGGGMPMIRHGDRLVSIQRQDGAVVVTPRDSLYVVQVRPEGFGLSLVNPSRNLLCLVFEPRPRGERARGAA